MVIWIIVVKQINWGPLARDKDDLGGLSTPGDFWDIDDLKRLMPCITTEEFIERERTRLSIPSKFTASTVQG